MGYSMSGSVMGPPSSWNYRVLSKYGKEKLLQDV